MNLQKKRLAEVKPDGVETIFASFTGEDGFWDCEFLQNIYYSEKHDEAKKLHIIKPKASGKYPLIVYIQGSAWHPQPVGITIPSMCYMAAKGYVVASVEYRNSDVATFPAPVEDLHTAIRFLKLNAEKYGIDKEKVAVWGDSSGGHVALMSAFTCGDYRGEDYLDQDESVRAVVDFYGVTDIVSLGEFNDALDHDAADSPEALLLGGTVDEKRELAMKASPYRLISEKPLPPVFIAHGNEDKVMHVTQSYMLYNKLREYGHNVTMYMINGADHGSGVWNSELLDKVHRFLMAHLFKQ